MSLENINVDLHPDLVRNVSNNPDALICVSGLAYQTACLLGASIRPEFVKSFTRNISDYFGMLNDLVIYDGLNPAEKELAQRTAKLWENIDFKQWIEMKVGWMDTRHTNATIQRQGISESDFTLNFAPRGRQHQEPYVSFNSRRAF